MEPAHCGCRSGRILRKFREDAALPYARFHDPRHRHASHLRAAGLPLHVVKEQLGHAAITTTADLYGHVLPDARRAVAEVMERLLSGGAWWPHPD